MGMDVRRFERDRERFVRHLHEDGAAHVGGIALELRKRIEATAPRRTGRLATGFNASFGDQPLASEPGVEAVEGMRLGHTAWVATGVPYAGFVEFGTSRMAARRFVAQALASMGLHPRWSFSG